MNKKIVLFTRNEPNETLAQYQRILRIQKLFSNAYNTEVILFNTYEPINKIKLIGKTKKKIKEYLKTLNDDVHIFIIDILDPWSIKTLNKYAKAHNIKVYIDIVEYADPKEKKFGSLSPSLILNHKMIKKSVTKDMTVLAISQWFISYYQKKGIKTIYLPNLIDEEDRSDFIVDRKGPVSFIFAGYPQKKDALDMIVLSLVELKENGYEFIFNIAGISEVDFFNKYPQLKQYESIIKSFAKFYGQQTRKEIKELYRASDFSIILRDPNLLVTQSGFPTKFMESLSFARPVIANLTSDIGLYLKDGYNGYIVNEFNSSALSIALKKALDNLDKRCIMFNNSLQSSKDYFSPSKFVDAIKEDEK